MDTDTQNLKVLRGNLAFSACFWGSASKARVHGADCDKWSPPLLIGRNPDSHQESIDKVLLCASTIAVMDLGLTQGPSL